MKDDFLIKYRTQPPHEFSMALYAQISKPKSQYNTKKMTLQNIALVIATLALIIACARVVTMPRFVEIGNIWVDVKNHLVIPSFPQLENMIPTQEQAPVYTLADIEAVYNGMLKIPDWVPDGYSFYAVIQMSEIGTDNLTSLFWKGSTLEQHVQLYANSMKHWIIGLDRYVVGPASTFPVAPGSFREVKVNGQSAVLIKGDWTYNFDLQENLPLKIDWDKKAAIQLYWIDGEWLYHLTASQDVSIDDLIRMAESSK